MIVCPVCDFRNPDSNDRCFRCSALLKRSAEEFDKARQAAAHRQRKYWLKNAGALLIDRVTAWRWVRTLLEVPEGQPYRYPFTAGLLSLLPGAGHWYAGHRPRALFFFCTAVPLIVLAVFTLRESWSNRLLLGVAVYWLVIWADAISLTNRANGALWSFRNTLAMIFALLFFFGIAVSGLQFFGSGVFRLERVTTDALSPDLRRGDLVFFSSTSYWFGRQPRVGDLVMYQPLHFSAEKGADIYSVLFTKYYQRVQGAPGDTLSWRGGRYLRNGVPVPPDGWPIGPADKLPEFDITVPEGRYYIPVTGISPDWLGALKGAGSLTYVGEPDFLFTKYPDSNLIPYNDIRGRAVVVLNPPERRRWVKP